MIQLAGVRVELNQVRDELEDCVEKQNFTRAAELKQRVEDLERTRNQLLEDPVPRSQEARVEKVL